MELLHKIIFLQPVVSGLFAEIKKKRKKKIQKNELQSM